MGWAAQAAGSPIGVGGRGSASGRSDHQSVPAFDRSRKAIPSGQAAPSAIQRRIRSTSSADSGSPSAGMSGRPPPSSVAIRSSSRLSSGLPGTTCPPRASPAAVARAMPPLALPGVWQRRQLRSSSGATSRAKSTGAAAWAGAARAHAVSTAGNARNRITVRLRNRRRGSGPSAEVAQADVLELHRHRRPGVRLQRQPAPPEPARVAIIQRTHFAAVNQKLNMPAPRDHAVIVSLPGPMDLRKGREVARLVEDLAPARP